MAYLHIQQKNIKQKILENIKKKIFEIGKYFEHTRFTTKSTQQNSCTTFNWPTTASYASSNIEKAGSIRSKTKAEFLENLNAKLAKQGLSGRAFAVRNLINSKALVSVAPKIEYKKKLSNWSNKAYTPFF